MKVLHICLGAFYPDGYSYQENMLPKFHKKMGHDVYVIAGLDVFDENGNTKWFSKGKEYIGDYDIPVCRLNLKGNIRLAKKFKNYYGLYQKICDINPDIIFVHNCQFICASEVVKYLKEHKEVRCYVDNHADFSNSATNWISKTILHKIIWKHMARKFQPYVKKFYGVLPARVDFLINIYGLPKEKCELLVMGADDDLVEKAGRKTVRDDIRNRYEVNERDILILTGGKIDAFKKQTLLLMDAVNSVSNPNVKLLVFGSVTKELKEEVDRRCTNKVKYIGWQNTDESYDLFGASDIACFPGRHSVFWEQVAGQGIPLIVKYWEGTTHIDMGGNCIFLYSNSAEEIKGIIEEFIHDNSKLNSMKESAKRDNVNPFLYSNIAAKAIELN